MKLLGHNQPYVKRTLSLLSLLIALAGSTFARSGIAEVNGTKLAYEIDGKGSTVVLIHGGLVDSRVWNSQFEEFAKKHRILRYDLRGFGKSDFPQGRFSHVADLYSLLNFLNIKHSILIGMSLGGTIAMDFTLEHPEMVDALVLTSSGLRGYQGVPNEKAAAIYKAAEREGADKAIEMWLEHPFFATGRSDPAYQQLTRTMLKENFRYWGPTPQPIEIDWPTTPTIQRLGAIQKPTLVVVGDQDFSNIQGIADVLVSRIKNARKVVIHGTSHHMNMERPAEYNRAVLSFLQNPKRK